MYNKKVYSGGCFDDEKNAGISVNLLCDKLGIERKNSKIDIEPDAIQQVMHSLSIIHGKVK